MPIVDYEALQRDVDRMAAGQAGVLVSAPVVAFDETGGSTRGPKLIPHTAASLAAFRSALLPWIDDLAMAFPGITGGSAYWAISPVARAPRTTQGGTPVGLGSDAAYFGEELAPHVLDILAVPPTVAASSGIEAWRDATCAHLLCREGLALISVWSPTFFTDLLAHMLAKHDQWPAWVEANAAGRGDGVKRRASLIRHALSTDPPDFRAIWPALEVVSCWDQAASRNYAQALRSMLPGVAIQGKGLLATEGVVTIPLMEHVMPVLAVESGFFELQDKDGACCMACDGRVGEEYALLMTTEGGLYRYAIGDRVRVHGYAGETPMLEFLGRDGLVSDLCGEKLSEAFAIGATAGLGLRFALLAPLDVPRRGYALLVDADELEAADTEAVAARVDEALCRNPQYAYSRRLGQLARLEVRRCTRPLETWRDAALERGMRLGDIKPPALSPEPGWEQRFQCVGP